jgi:hypothetical protein
MQVTLTESETRALIQTLEERLRQLRHEIIHTSTHDYRTTLKDHERVLQCLHDKLVTCHSIEAA